MADFGVTTEKIKGEIQGLALTATSTPTAAQVEEFILDATSEVANELRAKDIGIPTADSTGVQADVYRNVRRMVIALVCARTVTARGRGGDGGRIYTDMYRDARSTLRKLPAQIAPNRAPGSVNAPRTLAQQDPAVPRNFRGKFARSNRGV